jgi:hypothetical protein
MTNATAEAQIGTVTLATWTGQPDSVRVNWTSARSAKKTPEIWT